MDGKVRVRPGQEIKVEVRLLVTRWCPAKAEEKCKGNSYLTHIDNASYLPYTDTYLTLHYLSVMFVPIRLVPLGVYHPSGPQG